MVQDNFAHMEKQMEDLTGIDAYDLMSKQLPRHLQEQKASSSFPISTGNGLPMPMPSPGASSSALTPDIPGAT